MFSELQTIITIARQLNAKSNVGAKSPCPLPPLICITDEPRQKDPARIISQLPPDSLVIIRDYHHPDRPHYAACLAKQCRKQGLPFLVAGDTALALQLRAAGVHFPHHQIHQIRAWRQKQPYWVITTSAHSTKELHHLAALPVNAVLFSPVFATASHPQARALGRSRFGLQVLKNKTFPIYALGGVNAKTAPQLLGLPVAGIAAIGAFAPEPDVKRGVTP